MISEAYCRGCFGVARKKFFEKKYGVPERPLSCQSMEKLDKHVSHRSTNRNLYFVFQYPRSSLIIAVQNQRGYSNWYPVNDSDLTWRFT